MSNVRARLPCLAEGDLYGCVRRCHAYLKLTIHTLLRRERDDWVYVFGLPRMLPKEEAHLYNWQNRKPYGMKQMVLGPTQNTVEIRENVYDVAGRVRGLSVRRAEVSLNSIVAFRFGCAPGIFRVRVVRSFPLCLLMLISWAFMPYIVMWICDVFSVSFHFC